MINDKVWNDFRVLPVDSQKQVADFIAFLQQQRKRSRPKREAKLPDLRDEPFVGMWRDREDMADSVAYVKNLRATEWARRHG